MEAKKDAELIPVKQEDFLEQDPVIRGQRFACISFLNPGEVLNNKDTFYFKHFLEFFAKDVDLLFTNMTERFKEDAVVVDMLKNIKERYDYLFDVNSLQQELDLFRNTNNETLEAKFLEENNFRTSVQGIKVRGVYDTLKEARNRAEYIKRIDNKFDIYIAEVGCWCPWDPYATGNVDTEYAETQLNTLMKKYKENLENKDEFFRKRLEEKVQDSKNFDDDVNKASASAASESVPELLTQDPWLENKKQQENEDDDS